MKEFNLTEEEQTSREVFLEECTRKKKYLKDQKRRDKGKPQKYRWVESITFSYGSGIGVGVDITFGPYKKDITDYGSW